MNRSDLEKLSRDELIAQAGKLGVAKPRVLTQAELIDEILSRTAKTDKERTKVRGFLGRARDLLARVVEKGLNLPEAARVLRSTPDDRAWPPPPPPLPTVTLAEIYAAQGHLDRAIATLDEVLGREPGHEEARALRDRFAEQLARRSKPPKEATPSAAAAAPGASAPAAGTTEPASGAAAAEGEAVLPLDDEELPERYDLDEIVALAVDPRTLYVYWEVRPTTLARARAARPEGAMGIRLVSVVASWHGPETTTRDVRVDELYGERFLRDMTPGAEIRVSIGWIDRDLFEPFAVGMEVTAPRILPAENVAHAFGQWSAEPVGPFTRATPESQLTEGAPGGAFGGFGGGRPRLEVRTFQGPPTGGHAPVRVEVIEEIRQRVLERLRRTGASELLRERELVEERDRRVRERRPFGGASDRVRGGASERLHRSNPS